MDKNERTLQLINNIQANPVNSSISVTLSNFVILREVKTIRQNPNKFEDAFRICVELLFAINLYSLPEFRQHV